MAGNTETATCLQNDEIEQIKISFEGQVRVISGIGDFTHVVTIHPDGLDLHCKFQLTEAYPQTAPTISIRSSVLSADDTNSLTSYLQNEAATKLGHVMLAHIMATCKSWLQENAVDVTAIAVSENSKDRKRKGKSKPEKLKAENEPADTFVKKPPMKTAADVIKRLQWDKGINKEDFIVGYMDRIIGLVEKRFTVFTWEDLASVDMHSLAIPQHRIQYFKYKTEIVWDKTDRLDNVFGSTGSKLNIVDAVKRYEDKQKELNVEESMKETNETSKVDNVDHEDGVCGGDIEEDNESELEERSVEQSDAHSNHTMASSRPYQRPNYFIALHINNQDTIKKLVDQQMSIISKYPRYTDFKTPPNGFHLTLAVLQLASVADHQACVDAMNQATPTLEKLAKKAPALSFRGVDHFNTKVIYAKVKFSKEFLDLVDGIKDILHYAGFQMDSSNFRPHLTLFNVKRSAYANRSWKEEPNITSCCDMDTHFGSQAIDNIQVCQMGTLSEEEGTTKFYRNIFNMKID